MSQSSTRVARGPDCVRLQLAVKSVSSPAGTRASAIGRVPKQSHAAAGVSPSRTTSPTNSTPTTLVCNNLPGPRLDDAQVTIKLIKLTPLPREVEPTAETKPSQGPRFSASSRAHRALSGTFASLPLPASAVRDGGTRLAGRTGH